LTYHITRIAGTDFTDNRRLANQFIANSASQLGFKEINYSLWENDYLLNQPMRREALINAMFSDVNPGDTVVMTYPLYIALLNFNGEALNYLKNGKKDIKLIAFVIDLDPWMRGGDYDKEDNFTLNQLKQFDCLIVPTEKFAKRLHEDGVNTPTIVFNFLDFIYDGPLLEKKFQKKVYIASGRAIRLTNYNMDSIETVVIGRNRTPNDNIKTEAHRPYDHLPILFDGGFAAVDMINNVSTNVIGEGARFDWDKYSEYTAPSKQSLYMASGMPLIVRPENANAEFIKKAGIGLVMEDLSELDAILDKMTEEEYNQMVEKMKPFQKAVSSGYFAKRALMNAIAYVEFGYENNLE